MERYQIIYIILFTAILFVSACQKTTPLKETESMSMEDENFTSEFKKLCTDRTPDNWMDMREMRNGEFISAVSCWGCMSDDGMNHFCNMDEYKKYLENEK